MLRAFLVMGGLCFFHISLAHECLFPKPSGLWAIGTKAIEMLDNSRIMFRSDLPRRWMIQAFYPSVKHEGLYPYMPSTLGEGRVEGVKIFSYAKPNATVIRSQKFPVIIFVPGLGEERQSYTILCEELASHGYIVLSIEEPYISNFVRFLDGTVVVPTLKDLWKVPRDRDYRYRYYDEALALAIQDIKYLLSHLADVEAVLGENILDARNIILMGHSFGGNVANLLGFTDPRIRAVVDIDSKITDRKIFGQAGVPPNVHAKPVLFIRGSMQYQENVGAQLKATKNATIWAPNVQHSAFSDNAYLAAKIKGFGHPGFFPQTINWVLSVGLILVISILS